MGMRLVLPVVAGILGVSLPVLAGPSHNETMDAGSTKPTSQKIYKVLPDVTLHQITGQLSCPPCAGGVDREDMYLFKITDPAGFLASTDPNDCNELGCGFANFDSQLWLFQLSDQITCEPSDPGLALGLLANDDRIIMSGTSRILPLSDDGSGAQIMTPGCYLIAITAFDNDPVSAEGEIYTVPLANRTEISGPDGPGGQAPHQAWTGLGLAEPGSYRIIFLGAEGFPVTSIPTVRSYGLLALAALLATAGCVLAKRRRANEAWSRGA